MGTILVVDDNLDLCRGLIIMVRLLGGRAECALGGNADLAFVRADPAAVSLVLLDYMMPDLDGVGVLEALRADARTRELPVIFCTATPADDYLRERAAAVGASVVDKQCLNLGTLRPMVQWNLDAAGR